MSVRPGWSFADALHSAGPARDRADPMMLYGQFIGAWAGQVKYKDPDGRWRETSCEVHFGWVLEGRAVQDVWIAPARHSRNAGARGGMYGTTLRVYDPVTDLWQITWIDPARRSFERMEGRRVGDDIVQEYRSAGGDRCQWLFTEITDGSFHWISRESDDEGETWQTTGEVFVHRRAPELAANAPPPHQESASSRDFDVWIGGVARRSSPPSGFGWPLS